MFILISNKQLRLYMESTIISQCDISHCEDVVRKKKFSIFSIIFLAIAIITAYLYSTYQGEASSSLRITYLVVSFGMFCATLVTLLGGKKRIFLKATGERVKEYELFFDVRDYGKLSTAIETKQFSNISRMKQFQNDNSGIKMDILVSVDRRYVSIQLSEYKPFSYGIVSPLMTFRGDEAESLADVLLKQAVEV